VKSGSIGRRLFYRDVSRSAFGEPGKVTKLGNEIVSGKFSAGNEVWHGYIIYHVISKMIIIKYYARARDWMVFRVAPFLNS
jgi:hypothetical protein